MAYTAVPLSRQTSDGTTLFGHKIFRKASGLNIGCQVRRTAAATRVLVPRDSVIREGNFSCFYEEDGCFLFLLLITVVSSLKNR